MDFMLIVLHFDSSRTTHTLNVIKFVVASGAANPGTNHLEFRLSEVEMQAK